MSPVLRYKHSPPWRNRCSWLLWITWNYKHETETLLQCQIHCNHHWKKTLHDNTNNGYTQEYIKPACLSQLVDQKHQNSRWKLAMKWWQKWKSEVSKITCHTNCLKKNQNICQFVWMFAHKLWTKIISCQGQWTFSQKSTEFHLKVTKKLLCNTLTHHTRIYCQSAFNKLKLHNVTW